MNMLNDQDNDVLFEIAQSGTRLADCASQGISYTKKTLDKNPFVSERAVNLRRFFVNQLSIPRLLFTVPSLVAEDRHVYEQRHFFDVSNEDESTWFVFF